MVLWWGKINMDNHNRAAKLLKILCLEDSPADAEIISELIKDSGYLMKIDLAENEREFESFLRNGKYDIIISDFRLPGFDAFGALKLCNEICPGVPFICVSGSIGEDAAIELLKLGAVDYVLKDRPRQAPFCNGPRSRRSRGQGKTCTQKSRGQGKIA